MRLGVGLVVACVGVAALAGCGADKGGSSGKGEGKVVNGGTFTLALNSDPGNLDPQGNLADSAIQVQQLTYDHLLNSDENGKVVSGLASKWTSTPKQVTLTLVTGITCADGAAFTAADAATNINYVADPKNKSPFLGVFLPNGAHGTADAGTNSLTITLASPAPFVLEGLAQLGMVCSKGLNNRGSLAHGADGTGPYKLTGATPGNQYEFTKRTDYRWGPDGATTTTNGLPDKIVAKVVADQSTAANLLLSGGINAAIVTGAAATRLDKAKLYSSGSLQIQGEMWFNQAPGRVSTDKVVRQALTQAVDLDQLRQALTSNHGEAPTTFAAGTPVACPGKSIVPALPSYDLDAARKLLDGDGWKVGAGGVREKNGKRLALTFLTNTKQGAAGSAAAELAAAQWAKLGVAITNKPESETAINESLFSTGDWDILFETLNVSSPDALVPFLSGAVPPNGTNFAHISNAGYDKLIRQAQSMPIPQGCATWLSAESNLVRDSDVIPFANVQSNIYGSKAKFTQIGNDVLPTSIRMLSS